MRPHPKIRKTVKWGGAAALVLLAVVWALSYWYFFGYYNERGFQLAVGYGGCEIYLLPEGMPFTASFWFGHWPQAAHLDWHFHWSRNGLGTVLLIPLWVFFSPLVLATSMASWPDVLARRRVRIGQCTKCGYDRAGLAAGAVCPECGAGEG